MMVRGMRYPVEMILEYLSGGETFEDLLKEFPDLEREDILACHAFSSRKDDLSYPFGCHHLGLKIVRKCRLNPHPNRRNNAFR